MTTSELGQVVRADHDYIDLLVNVKDEEDSTDDHETELDSNRTEFDRVRLDHSDFDDEDRLVECPYCQENIDLK